MEDEDDFEPDVWRPDTVCQRADALRFLAETVDSTRDKDAKRVLLRAMERITDFLVDPKDNIKEINRE